MTLNIKYSYFSLLLTIIIIAILIIGCFLTFNESGLRDFYLTISILIVLIVCALLWGAWKIEVNSDFLIMHSPLKSRKLRIRDIEKVELFQPTMGAIRIWASGVFMGYWGLFREGDIGRYYAFYGKSSDCFLIRMKNGDKYVLGCDNPQAMVNYIHSLISAGE